MQRRWAIAVLAVVLIGCTDAVAPPKEPPVVGTDAPKSSDVLAQVNEAILATVPPDAQSGLTIGVLDEGLSETQAIIMIAQGREAEHFYRYKKLAEQWKRAEEVQLRRKSSSRQDGSVAAGVDWEGAIAELTLYTGSQTDMLHIWDVKAGSYVSHKYTSTAGLYQNSGFDSGAWLGGVQWVADTLFELKFSRWDYAANGYWCAWGPKSSSRMYTNFRTATDSINTPYRGTCGATDVHLWYSIRKQISPVVANFTSGPTSITTSGSYQWGLTVSGGFNNEYSYSWEKSTDQGGSWTSVCTGANYTCSLWVGSGDPSFVLRATVSSGGHTEYPALPVSVHIAGPGDPPPPYVVLSGSSELAHQEWGDWSAALSNGQALASCDWFVDGQLISEAAGCDHSESWSDGYSLHTVSVVGHGAIDYPSVSKDVTVLPYMECGPEGCMSRRKRLPGAAEAPIIAKKAPLTTKRPLPTPSRSRGRP
jgi:hypothetical protein